LTGGRLPYFDTFFDYPPGIGYVAGVFARLTGGPVPYVVAWAAVAAGAAGAVALLLAREASPARAILFWSLSPQLVLYGGSNFDAIPTALVVGALVLARRGRSLGAMFALALGALAKIFPAGLAPLELERLRRSRGKTEPLAAAAVFLGTVLVIAAPSLVAAHPSTEGVLAQAARTNFDSVWGLVLAALEGVSIHHAGDIVWAASLIGTGVSYALVLRRASADVDPARLALLGLLALLLWTRLYSPQYSIWIVPFFALVAVPVRSFVLLSVADVAVFATVYPLTLVAWPSGDTTAGVLFGALATAVVLRHVALLWIWRHARQADVPGDAWIPTGTVA
jgi:uncharacterized membrane protein